MAVITISGMPNTGKTTLSQKLALMLGYQHFYMGGEMRKLAKERGESIERYYEKLKSDPEFEKSMDARMAKKMCEKTNLIAEGRVAFYFPVPADVLKINVFLTVTPHVGALRGLMRPENKGRALGEIMERARQRVEEERARYHALYNIADHCEHTHFDIVLDTTPFDTIEKAFDALVGALDAHARQLGARLL